MTVNLRMYRVESMETRQEPVMIRGEGEKMRDVTYVRMATEHLPGETPDSELTIKTLSREHIYSVGSTGTDYVAVRFGEPTLGNNVLENPLFANPSKWTTGVGWRIEHGVATFGGLAEGYLYQEVKAGLAVGEIYRFRGVTAAWVSGGLMAYFASGPTTPVGEPMVEFSGLGIWEGAGVVPAGAKGIVVKGVPAGVAASFSIDSVVLQKLTLSTRPG